MSHICTCAKDPEITCIMHPAKNGGNIGDMPEKIWIASPPSDDGFSEMIEVARTEIYGGSTEYTRSPVWIPVSERLPEDGQYVLVGVQSRGTVMLAKYFGDGGFSVYPQKDVTHWMSLLPLPIPPLEQEKNNERYS